MKFLNFKGLCLGNSDRNIRQIRKPTFILSGKRQGFENSARQCKEAFDFNRFADI